MAQLFNWLRRRKLEQDLARELAYHLDRRVAELETTGLTANEARRKAALEIGGIGQVQEEVRDVWLTRWLRDFVYDLRFSLRSFLRTPTFTTTAVLSLTLGIGATTAIYSLVDQVLLQGLPVREPGRLVLVNWEGEAASHAFGSWNLLSYPLCRDLDQEHEFFEGAFCRALTTINLSTGGPYEPAEAEIVSGNYFELLGVPAFVGRTLGKQDDRTPGSNSVAVLSYSYWQRQFAGSRDVIGHKILINQHPFEVVGVTGPSFQGVDLGNLPELWVPASMSGQVIPGFEGLESRRVRWMQVFGRLQPRVDVQRAQAGLQPWFKAMLREDLGRPGFPVVSTQKRQEFLNSWISLTLAPQGHSLLKRRLVKPLWVLFCVTALLLGLACLNVAGLFLARGSARERELTTRVALGASGGRISRQLLADSLLIALCGGLLGTLLAPLAGRALIAFIPVDTAANGLKASIDSRLLLFAFAVTVMAGLFSGLAPAWQSGRRSLASSLRERTVGVAGSVRLRKALVVSQIALTLVLLIGAALFMRTLDALTLKGPGFSTVSLVSFGIEPDRSGFADAEAHHIMAQLNETIRQLPIVESAGVSSMPLLTGGSWNDPVTLQGKARLSIDREIRMNAVTPEFFRTLQVKLLSGRNFDSRDVRTAAEKGHFRSAIVNEAFVKSFLKGQNPLGFMLCEGIGPDANPDALIVGVISNFSYRGLREDSEQVYFPFFEGNGTGGAFYVRVRGTPEEAFSSLRKTVHDVSPSLVMLNLRTVNEQVERSLNTERLLALLSESFGVLALLLSLVGLYGVMSFVVALRTREIGIRVALGARRASAVWLILRDALSMLLFGVVLALPAAWALARLIESQLFDVSPHDPEAWALAVVCLSIAVVAAAWLPAKRASSVDPSEALRLE